MKATYLALALALTSVSAGETRCHEKSADGGMCRGSFQMWTYMEGKGCHSFTYGGCGGNMNRFPTEKECEDICEQGELLTPHDMEHECCPQMKIGKLTYELVGREDMTFVHEHGCLSDCIYMLDNKMVCFQKGNILPAVPLDLEATKCKFYSDEPYKGEKDLANILGKCGIVKGQEVGWLQILDCEDIILDAFTTCDKPMSSEGLDQAEILECEEAFLDTLEKLGIQHNPNNKIFLQTFSEVDNEGDGNGVVTMEEWVWWKMNQESGESGTPAGKGSMKKAKSLGNINETTTTTMNTTTKAYGDYGRRL